MISFAFPKQRTVQNYGDHKKKNFYLPNKT